jgi:hypothetical protein
MSYRATLLPREPAPGVLVTTEALEQAARKLRAGGTITIRDPNGDQHEVKVTDVQVTERGLEATVHLTSTGFDALVERNTLGLMSIGCKVEEPPCCSSGGCNCHICRD